MFRTLYNEKKLSLRLHSVNFHAFTMQSTKKRKSQIPQRKPPKNYSLELRHNFLRMNLFYTAKLMRVSEENLTFALRRTEQDPFDTRKVEKSKKVSRKMFYC